MRLDMLFLERYHRSALTQHQVGTVIVYNVDMTIGRGYTLATMVADGWMLMSRRIPYTGEILHSLA